MSTRSQKRRNNQQENTESVSEGLYSPVLVENVNYVEQDVIVTGLPGAKSSRFKNSVLKSLRAALKEEITSKIKGLLLEYQGELLKLLKPKTGENIKEEAEDTLEDEPRSFHTPTRSVRINSIQTNDP